MKSVIKNKIKKEDIILFICVFIFASIVNSAFLHRHYSSDAMCLIEHGYFDYPSHYFLLDGRIISTLVCYLGGVLHLPIDVYLFISNFIGLLLLSLAVTILYKFVIKYLEINNKWIQDLALFSVYTIIFNHMDIDYLLFPESCIMCAGILFSVLAAITYLKQEKRYLIKSFGLLFVSTMCYQGLISIFPTLVITLSLLKKKDKKIETIKFYIKEIFKVGIMFSVVMLISAGIIAIFNYILQSSSYRLERIGNIFNVARYLPISTYMLFLDQAERIPKYLSVYVICIMTVIILKYGKSLNLLIKYLLVVFTAYVFCMVPILAFGYIHARMLMAIGAVMGLSLLFATSILLENQENISMKNTKTVIVSSFIMLYFVFNVINNGINGYEHLKASRIDEAIGKRINEIVTEYERTSGERVTKISFYGDMSVQGYETGIKPLGSLTERKYAMPHCMKQTLNYYCNRKFEEVRFLAEIYYKNINGRDYTGFSEKQLIFKDDTLYMCVY